jgi:hypothetical protein
MGNWQSFYNLPIDALPIAENNKTSTVGKKQKIPVMTDQLVLDLNPATDRQRLHIRQLPSQSVDLFNAAGIWIARKDDVDQFSIADLLPGFYVVKVNFVNGTTGIKSFVKR